MIPAAMGRLRNGSLWLVPLLILLSPALRAQESGESLFKAKCAMCHAADGSGQSPMGKSLKVPDLHSAEIQGRSEAELKAAISKGKNKMPAYEGKLSKEQIDKLADYIRKLGKH
jgi:mono/diheme cytochrome c family protein